MSNDKAHQIIKDRAHQWQRAASTRRAEDARRAGVSSNSVNYTEHTHRRSKRSSKRKSSTNRRRSTSLVEEPQLTTQEAAVPKGRSQSMTATRISNPNQGGDICFHKPIRVRFNSTSDSV